MPRSNCARTESGNNGTNTAGRRNSELRQNIVDTVREPLLILDTTLRVRSANRAFYQTFHVSAEETEGRLIYELGNGQWDIPDLRTLLEDIVPKSSVFANLNGFPDARDGRP